MANKIQLKRGLKSRITTLSAGEPAYTTDTRELFIGTGSGNVNMSGSQWYTGTAMSGTSTSTTYYYSACPQVKLGDIYLNTSNGNIYQCTTAGSSTTARWTYKGNIKGPQGVQGKTEDPTDLLKVMAGLAGFKNAEFEFETINSTKYIPLSSIGKDSSMTYATYCYKAEGIPEGSICGHLHCMVGDFVEGTASAMSNVPRDSDGFITQCYTDTVTGEDYIRDVPLVKSGNSYILYNDAFSYANWLATKDL